MSVTWLLHTFHCIVAGGTLNLHEWDFIIDVLLDSDFIHGVLQNGHVYFVVFILFLNRLLNARFGYLHCVVALHCEHLIRRYLNWFKLEHLCRVSPSCSTSILVLLTIALGCLVYHDVVELFFFDHLVVSWRCFIGHQCVIITAR